VIRGGGLLRVPGRSRLGSSVTHQKVKPGTIRRIIPYAAKYRWALSLLLFVTALDALITVSVPLMLRMVINDGILPRRVSVVVALSLAVAGLAALDALAEYIQARYSARISQDLIYNLRTDVIRHVQQQSVAFFTRSQTGSLVSRLNTDVITAQQAITSLLSQSVSVSLTLVLVLAAMFYLSWQITVIALVVLPLLALLGKRIGRKLQQLSREQMQLGANLGALITERFNVSGAMLVKLYGRPAEESALVANTAGKFRDAAVATNIYGRSFSILIVLLTSLTTALVYGLGGALIIDGAFQIGTLVALVTLLTRLYGPVNQVSGMQINVLTAIVSFDRVFEILDLKPLVEESPGAHALSAAGSSNGAAPEIEFDRVCFRYPSATEVSLASLESIALPVPERADGTWVLNDVSFRAPAGRMTALVGPSGAGKSTITHLVPRLYDPSSGTVRIGSHDIRDLTLQSLNSMVGVVTQEAHLFHETIRANLMYARPDATEQELTEACKAAQIWGVIAALPDRLNTVVGDRGYRLSGGEKQRVAMARLLLKAPPIVVLDEATAHLDSESEAAIQRALKAALAGRTSLVIAHRLSTIREADQILVINEGRVQESGTHDELLATGGLYAELYRTQFAQQATRTGDPMIIPTPSCQD
jgi:ATP-binding cassette subfamily B protein